MSGPTVLLAGFMPFDAFELNSSWEMIRHLDGAEVGGAPLRTVEVPVLFGRGAEVLIRAAGEVEPGVVISLGLADSPHIRLETTAVNLADARIPDNGGAQPRGEPIIPGGPGEYRNALPMAEMIEALRGEDIPVQYSDSAGTFVCNDVFYRLMHWRAGSRPDALCGFLHVPPLEGHGGKNGWDLERLRRSAEVIVRASLS